MSEDVIAKKFSVAKNRADMRTNARQGITSADMVIISTMTWFKNWVKEEIIKNMSLVEQDSQKKGFLSMDRNYLYYMYQKIEQIKRVRFSLWEFSEQVLSKRLWDNTYGFALG